MNDEQRIRVDSEFYVNQATLELLRRKIESEVKGGFFRSIGLPIGGAGVVTILLTLFVWIPDKIGTVIEKNPVVQQNINSAAIAYLSDPERGKKFVHTQVEDYLRSYLADPERGQKFMQQQIESMAQEHVKITTNKFFEERGEAVIREQGDKYLRSQEVKDLVIRAINHALRPKTAALSEEIGRNIARLVVEIEEPFRDVIAFDKGSLGELHEFLGTHKAEELKRKEIPIALTLRIRQGERYAKFTIDEYLNELGPRFGKGFRCVLILDNDGKFLALFPPQLVNNQDPNRLMRLLNAGPQLSTTDAIKELERMFTKRSTLFIQSNWSIKQALTMPVWSPPYMTDEEVAVVDGRRIFRGITTRRLLIEGTLS